MWGENENIEVAGMCSVCHPDLFFSYRREGGKGEVQGRDQDEKLEVKKLKAIARG